MTDVTPEMLRAVAALAGRRNRIGAHAALLDLAIELEAEQNQAQRDEELGRIASIAFGDAENPVARWTAAAAAVREAIEAEQ